MLKLLPVLKKYTLCSTTIKGNLGWVLRTDQQTAFPMYFKLETGSKFY